MSRGDTAMAAMTSRVVRDWLVSEVVTHSHCASLSQRRLYVEALSKQQGGQRREDKMIGSMEKRGRFKTRTQNTEWND